MQVRLRRKRRERKNREEWWGRKRRGEGGEEEKEGENQQLLFMYDSLILRASREGRLMDQTALTSLTTCKLHQK